MAPWTFTDAIDAGRTADALIQLHRLLGGGERHPLVVLAILHRHVQSLLRVDSPSIRTEGEAAAAMGIATGPKHLSGQEGAWHGPAVGIGGDR